MGASLIVGPSESFVDNEHSMTHKMHMHDFASVGGGVSALRSAVSTDESMRLHRFNGKSRMPISARAFFPGEWRHRVRLRARRRPYVTVVLSARIEMKPDDAVVLVTGANRGLGRAFVEGLKAAGAKRIYAAARDPARVATPGVQPVRLDVTRADDVAAAARDLRDVNLLVNNAGIYRTGSLVADADGGGLQAQLDTNFFGLLAMARAFAPVLRDNGGGAIVNVLSVLSWLGVPNAGAYGISKAAAWAATNAIRNELREQRTRVLALHSAYIDTDMVASARGVPKNRPEDVVRQTLDALAAGRDEVLVDDLTRAVKAGLSADPAVYTQPPMGA
ncbi:oxidoreductase, short-chain dehydrogenase/reductase family [Burkholderia thailandensis E264]|uniref:Oxidoreductase, short-chain dehydrogenase/reductase family n=2 Tax=Burkholderia thailandensis TaxID=57975 RepID=Q2T1P0_BURTA|nr:oxidoreductase, short-chain dehydrogenase/reductase family [Burkholderia thailandensis E264]